MGDIERGNFDMMHRLQSTFNDSNQQFLSSNYVDVSHLNMSQITPNLLRNPENSQNFGFENNGSKKIGLLPPHPPISPFPRPGRQNLACGPSHSRSLSQPSLFLNDSLLPLFPSLYQNSASLPSGGENVDSVLNITEGVPPRKLHRRCVSDVPFGFDSVMQSTPPTTVPVGPTRNRGGLESTKTELRWGTEIEGDVDDMLSAFINMDSIDPMNSSETGGKPGHLESRVNNGCDSSENEAESRVNATTRHNRSVSMDSFMGNMNFGDESAQLLPSPNTGVGRLSLKDSSKDSGNLNFNLNLFSSGLGFGQFTADDMTKILSNEKLLEVALNDPKRAKRILANRHSAARSKERRMKYISELEQKVQTLQSEATNLSARVSLLQRDSNGLASQNNELKFRLHALEQQSHLQNSLNTALTAEAQRLKIATGELNQESTMSTTFEQQLYMNPQIFQLQQQQLLSQNMARDLNNGFGMNNESTLPNQ
ncbi:hypothetical protein RND81_14G240400 [Saponaria officinalis]|uniref:BZIP domain-containing protein n=1 Tax=Saponaria officinalis TaxID=3572 RepID=A0AAW1GXC7_SAPOF